MRFLFYIITYLLAYGFSYSQNQEQKLKGYVIGNTPKEHYTIYFNGEWKMTFKGEAYKIAFEINRLPAWENTGYVREFTIMRKTLFGMKRVPFEVAYDPSKKYLIISRDRGRKKSRAFVGRWSDEIPEKPPANKR
jgi:hypothetical protein